jgi:hypothetical protein
MNKFNYDNSHVSSVDFNTSASTIPVDSREALKRHANNSDVPGWGARGSNCELISIWWFVLDCQSRAFHDTARRCGANARCHNPEIRSSKGCYIKKRQCSRRADHFNVNKIVNSCHLQVATSKTISNGNSPKIP